MPDHRLTASSIESVDFPSFGLPAITPDAPSGQTPSTAQRGSAGSAATKSSSETPTVDGSSGSSGSSSCAAGSSRGMRSHSTPSQRFSGRLAAAPS